MQHTLITVFDNRADAQSAKDALLAAGFARTDIRADDAAAAGTATDAPGQHGVVASIRHFFADLFGSDEAHKSAPYNEAVARGMFVVTVVTTSEGEIEGAAAIVERYGPVDIDEQGGGRFVSGGTGQAATPPPVQAGGAQRQGATMSQQSAGGASEQGGGGRQGDSKLQAGGNLQGGEAAPAGASAQREGGSAAAQVEAPGSPQFFDAAAQPPAQAQVQQRATPDAPSAAPVDKDSYYYMHYQSIYSVDNGGRSYEDYLPAYHFGADRAAEQSERGRAWDEVEPALKRDWEARNSGSAWEHFKAAVRHGWEKVKR